MRKKNIIPVLSAILLVSLVTLCPRPVHAASPTVLTQKIWGGSAGEIGQAVATDRFGNIYVTGTTYTYTPGSCATLYVLKYSASGNLLWQKAWWNGSASVPTAIAVDPSGNIYVTGKVDTSCVGFEIGMLLKLDPYGNLAWEKTISQSTDSLFTGLAVDASGNVFVTGFYYTGPAGNQDVLIMRFDTNGNLVWQKAWGGASTDIGNGIAIDATDNVYVTGYTISFGPSSNNLVLLKLNSFGQFQFQRIVGSGSASGQGVGLDPTGNIYVAGKNQNKILLLKFDPAGNNVWQRTWGGTNNEKIDGLAMDASADMEIAGATSSYGPGGTCGLQTCFDILLLKVDSSGNLLSQLVYGTVNVNQEAYGIADSYGTMVAVGYISTAPPYTTATGNTTLGMPSLPITATGNNTLGQPTFPTPDTHFGALYTISGNQAFTAAINQFMLTFGSQPQLGFTTTPGTGGSIMFNGTRYSNGQYLSIISGTANATAVPGQGYKFTGWNASGGIYLSSTSDNTTQVTFAGPGTLNAKFQQIAATPSPTAPADYTLYYLAAITSAAAAAVVFATLFFIERRKRPTEAKAAQPKSG